MAVARKIRIFLIALFGVAVLSVAFLMPVSYSRWSGSGVTANGARTGIGYWGVYVVFPDNEHETLYLARNGTTYNGAISVNAGTRVQIVAAGYPLTIYPYKATDSNKQDNGDVTVSGDVYTLVKNGNYRLIYTYGGNEKLVVSYVDGNRTLDDIFGADVESAENDKALMNILKDEGKSSALGGGVRGCVTSSGSIVEIVDNTGSEGSWKAVISLKKDEKVAFFGKPVFSGSSTKISKCATNMNPNSDMLIKLNSGYFQAKEVGTYTVYFTGGWTDFQISGISFKQA